MTFDSGLTALTILVLAVVIVLVAYTTFRNPPDNRWHKPVGIGMIVLLTARTAFIAWWGWFGGVK